MLGTHQLIEVIGRGATGEVWRAIGPRPLAREVAIKRVGAAVASERQATMAEALRAEAEVLAALDHPHIVRVHEVLDDGHGVALVMDLARGGSLGDLLAERHQLSPGQVVALAAPLADALASAHRKGVVHGDVKPANVVLTADGEPLLVDFGVARQVGAPAGTDGFIDPDLEAGGERGAHNDVFALGVLVHLALTGRLPDVEAVPVDGAEPLLAAAAAACHRDPADRPDAQSLARRLRTAVDRRDVVLPGVPGEARATTPDGPSLGADLAALIRRPGAPLLQPARPAPVGVGTRTFGPQPTRPVAGARRWLSSRRRVAAAVGGAALLLVVMGGAVALGGGGPPPAPAAAPVAGRPVATIAGPAPTPSSASCPERPPLAGDGHGMRRDADLRGDGCLVPLRWDGEILEVSLDLDGPPRRYRLRPEEGGPGALLLGDWDCDGAESPAYHQPATGLISYFAHLPDEVGEPLAATRQETARVGGTARVVARGDCDEIEVAASR